MGKSWVEYVCVCECVCRVLLCQHCGIFPKMHIASIQIGDVFIGVHRKAA